MDEKKRLPFLVLLTFLIFLGGGIVFPQPASAGDTLVISSWGGAYGKAQEIAYYKPFEEKTGIRVVATGEPHNAKMKAMVMTGNIEWDIVDIGISTINMVKGYDGLEKIDYSQFDKKLLDEMVEGALNPYGVGNMIYSYVLAYRTDVFKKETPKGWKDFWDVKRFPGPRCFMSGATGGSMLELALLADDVPMDKLYPLDVERAFRMLTKIKPYVSKWWVTGSTPPQLISDKEVVMTSAYHGRIAKLMENGVPVKIVWNQGQLVAQYWAIMKGSKNYKNALRFIEFASQAKNQANLVNNYSVSPVNKKAFDFIPAEKKQYISTSPENIKGQFWANPDWWAENRERVIERWNQWILEK